MSDTAAQHLYEMGSRWGISIYRPGITQLHFLVQPAENLRPFCAELQQAGYYLVSMIANDERELEDHCFKIYHLFSHPSMNLFVTLELSVQPERERYPSVSKSYPAVETFEREIADLFGLYPEQDQARPLPQTYLHNSYPEWFHPLRRDSSLDTLKNSLKDTQPVASFPAALGRPAPLQEGELFLPVGPIHAGVIEPGNFLFRISSEVIDAFDVLLGYTHKGTERLFQSSFSIMDGYLLAEKVSGDSSFAHGLAYCKAAEHLSRTNIPEPTNLLRAVFLELERIINHIGDCSALAHDLALEIIASDMAVLREELMRLCGSLTNSRFLRGVNRPGGLCLPRPFDKHQVMFTVHGVVQGFLNLANMLILRSDFRERTLNTGVLSAEAARALGVTGLAARAAGLDRDFRLQHPFGPYIDPEIQKIIKRGGDQTGLPFGQPNTLTGDVFSRFIQRVVEVEISGRLIERFAKEWKDSQELVMIEPLLLEPVPNYETGLGYVEGWRGDIVYWLMLDKFERIFRCKVRDPSMLNWPGLRQAVVQAAGSAPAAETALVDFPVINKSFNLSYSGVDL